MGRKSSWSSVEDKKLYEFVRMGMKYERIARTLGRPVSACTGRYRRIKERMTQDSPSIALKRLNILAKSTGHQPEDLLRHGWFRTYNEVDLINITRGAVK
jgi:hypothetical protein